MTDLYARRILSGEQLEAIGCIAVESAAFDVYIEQIIWHLSGMDEQAGRLFTTGLTFGPRLDRMAELIEQRIGPDDYKKYFAILIGDIKHENTSRNDAIHGLWSMTSVTDIGNDENGNPLLVRNSHAERYKKDGKSSTIKPSDCLRIAVRLSSLHDQLSELLLSRGLLKRP